MLGIMRKLQLAALFCLLGGGYAVAAVLENFSGSKPQLYLDNGVKRNQEFTVEKAPGSATPAGKISWKAPAATFAEAIFLDQNILPEFTAATIAVKIYTSANCPVAAINLCLSDANHEIFQWNQKVDWKTAGWKTLIYKVTPKNFDLTWESARVHRFDHPAKLFGFNIDFRPNAGAGEFWIDEISFITAGGERVVVTMPFFTFDRREKWQARFESGNGKIVPSFAGLSVNAQASAVLLTNRLKGLLPRPKPATVILNAQLISGEVSLQLIFRGSNGKTAESVPCRILPGDNQMEIGLTRQLSALPGPVTLEAIRLASLNRNFAVVLNNAAILYHLPAIEAIRIEAMPTHPLHLLYVGDEKDFKLQFTNSSAVTVAFRARLQFTGPDGQVQPLQHDFELEPNSNQNWQPAWQPPRQGVWQMDYTLTDLNTPESVQHGRQQFAYLRPVELGSTPWFAIGSRPETFSLYEQELESQAAGICGASLQPASKTSPRPEWAGANDQLQAVKLFKGLVTAWTQGQRTWQWPEVRNTGLNRQDPAQNSGLMTIDFQPKAAFATAVMLVDTFQPLKYRQKFELGPDCGSAVAWLFQDDHDAALPGWTEKGEVARFLQTDAEPVAQLDLNGNATAVPVIDRIFFHLFTPVPTLLTFPAKANLRSLGAPVGIMPETVPVLPGAAFIRQAELRNPWPHPCEYELKLILPSGITADKIVQTVQVPAADGKTGPSTAAASFKFQLAPQLKGRYGRQQYPIQLHYALKNTPWQGTETIPVELPISIPHGIDFSRTPDFTLNRKDQTVNLIADQPWNGPGDLGARIWLGTNGRDLLLRADIHDNQSCQPAHGADAWQGDSLQFILQTGARRWKIGLTRLDNGKPDLFVWTVPSGVDLAKLTAKIRLDVQRQKDHTLYSAALPLAALKLTPEQLRQGIRFNLLVNDNDTGLRKNFIRIAPGISQDNDQSSAPLLVFE